MLVLLGLQVFFFSSFIAFDLPTATGQNLKRWSELQASSSIDEIPAAVKLKINKVVPLPDIQPPTKPVRISLYSPQAPIAILLGYALGFPIATISAAIFILIGLVGPYFGLNPFASGGGLDYYSQPGFGYLLGILAATFVVAKITGEKRTSVRQVGALIAGLLTIHSIGLLYLMGSALLFSLLDGSARPEWLPWVFEQARNLSWCSLPYDAAIGLALIGLGFPIRYLVEMLTAPDIGLKTENDRVAQQRIEELLQ
ncbi:MAG: biotin transporter BioY [Cyanobacteria bacterium SZAS-4]|nr:biotin transporter BioY [Cyanobacteria bacterium SZAS-4]